MRRRVRKLMTFLLAIAIILSTAKVDVGLVFAEENKELEIAAGMEAETAAAMTESSESEMAAAVTEVAESEITTEVAEIPESETTAVTEIPESETATEDKKEKIEYEPTKQPEGMVVKAYADPEVFPENVTMVVKKMEARGEEAAAYAVVEKDLAKSGIEYDGFLALDISFYDPEGNEIEPEAGTVEVEFELQDSLLPEDADKETLAIQHHAKVGEKIEVQPVADVNSETSGEIEAQGAVVKADFVVESFSSFTITWQTGNWWIFNSKKTVKIEYVDSGMNQLPASVGNLTFNLKEENSDKSIEISDYTDAMTAPGYQFMRAVIKGYEGVEPVALRGVNDGLLGLQMQYRLEDGSWHDFPSDADTVRLIYAEDTTQVTIKEVEPWHEKKVERSSNNDGSYDLSLSVTGATGNAETKTQVDIIYMVDYSSSMSSNAATVKQTINNITNNLHNNPKIDAHYGMLGFYEQGLRGITDTPWNDAVGLQGWTSNPANITSTNLNISVLNGAPCNYEAGLRMATEWMSVKRPNAIAIVVFIASKNSDCHYDQGNGRTTGGTSLTDAKNQIAKLKTDYFYAVGVTNTVNAGSLNDLVSATRPGTKTAVLTGDVTATLSNLFAQLEDDVLDIQIEDVLIEDTLSSNVDLTRDSLGQLNEMIVSVLDPSGEDAVPSAPGSVTFNGAVITAVYDTNERKIRLEFPDGYALEKDYTYKVTANIIPTLAAYQEYKANSYTYPNRADAGTGEHSGDDGFYSNSSAFLTYTHNSEEHRLRYDHPVVQLDPQDLRIEKTISGLSQAELEALIDTMKFDVIMNAGKDNEEGIRIPLSSFTPEDGVYKYQLTGFPPGTYTVSEVDYEVAGYNVAVAKSNETGALEGGTVKTATFTNTYTKANKTLSITKVVAGDMGDKLADFDFTLTVENPAGTPYTANINYTSGTDPTVKVLANTAGVYTFKLKHNEVIHLELPNGCKYTVDEDEQEYTLAISNHSGSVTDGILTGTLSADAEATFTNTKNMAPLTGLSSMVMPYLIAIITAAGIAFTIFKRRPRISG